jgi:hypothetical protein
MTSFGPDLHVFIIRARREPREIPGASPEWRFWIEHHPGGEQRNLRDFAAVVEFITRYVPDLRTEPARWDRIARRFVKSDPSRDE